MAYIVASLLAVSNAFTMFIKCFVSVVNVIIKFIAINYNSSKISYDIHGIHSGQTAVLAYFALFIGYVSECLLNILLLQPMLKQNLRL